MFLSVFSIKRWKLLEIEKLYLQKNKIIEEIVLAATVKYYFLLKKTLNKHTFHIIFRTVLTRLMAVNYTGIVGAKWFYGG